MDNHLNINTCLLLGRYLKEIIFPSSQHIFQKLGKPTNNTKNGKYGVKH